MEHDSLLLKISQITKAIREASAERGLSYVENNRLLLHFLGYSKDQDFSNIIAYLIQQQSNPKDALLKIIKRLQIGSNILTQIDGDYNIASKQQKKFVQVVNPEVELKKNIVPVVMQEVKEKKLNSIEDFEQACIRVRIEKKNQLKNWDELQEQYQMDRERQSLSNFEETLSRTKKLKNFIDEELNSLKQAEQARFVKIDSREDEEWE